MTETTMNTSNPLDGERIAGTVGFPLPGVELRVVDVDGRTLPQGAVGVLVVKGPHVFRGYWRQPEKTAAEFRKDGFFITGRSEEHTSELQSLVRTPYTHFCLTTKKRIKRKA